MPDKIALEKELELFALLQSEEVVSQAALSKRISISVGMVNTLMKRVVRKGLVKTRSAPYRRWAYYLTPAGFAEKSRLVTRYLENSLDFFRKAREEYDGIFSELRSREQIRAVLVGHGELAEIAFLAARCNDVEIVGLLDAQMSEERFLGIPVLRELREVEKMPLVMTASRHPQEVYDLLCAQSGPRSVHAPGLLHLRLCQDVQTGTMDRTPLRVRG